MKTLSLLLFCLFYWVAVFAQKARPVIEFCPLCLVDDFSFPTVQAGVEFNLSGKWSLYNEFGIKYRKSTEDRYDTIFIGSGGFKCKTELRYNIYRPTHRLQNVYFAMNAFYNYNTYNTLISYYYQKDSLDERNDGFGVKKSVLGFNILVGLKQKIWRRFSFNPYAGIGLRLVNVTPIGKEFNPDRDKLIQPVDVTIYGMRQGENAYGEGNGLNITTGIRICYRL